MNPAIEAQILEYLRDQASDKRERNERERLRDTAIQNLTNQQLLTCQKIDNLRELVDERIRGLSARVDRLEDDLEDTGKHSALANERLLVQKKDELERLLQDANEKLAQKAEEERLASVWWRREWVKVTLTIIGGLILAMVLAKLGFK